MAVTGNHRLLVLSLLMVAMTVVFSAGIPGSNETWRPAAAINCSSFNASTPCLSPDSDRRYCLENGSLVTGQCAVQRALCLNNVSVEVDISICTNSISDTVAQRPREGLESSTISSTTASTLSAAGRGFFGEAVTQFDGPPLTSTKTTTRVEEKTSTASVIVSSTIATLSGSNGGSSQGGEASSTTRITSKDTQPMSLSSDTTSSTTAGRQVSTTDSSSTSRGTFTNNEKTFHMTAISTTSDRNPFSSSGTPITNNETPITNNETPITNNETTFNTSGTAAPSVRNLLSSSGTPVTNNETLTNHEQTFNISGPSSNNDRNTFSSIGSSLENDGGNSTSFGTSKQLGNNQTLSDDKTLRELGAPVTNGNNTASILATSTWQVFSVSLSLAIVYAGHQLIIF